MSELRADLPPGIPERMKKLPVHRGFPVPWFVQWLTEEGSTTPTPVGEGYPEFRMMRPQAWEQAVTSSRCWVCGDTLGRFKSFVVGPMCGINRTTAEPPCHRDCAEWSAAACPFLSNPKMVRRENKLEGGGEMPGVGILRNPKVAMVWTTTDYSIFDDGKGGNLIAMGEPIAVEWFHKGGEATREQVVESIESGLPLLEATLEKDPPDQQEAGRDELARRRAKLESWLPAAV